MLSKFFNRLRNFGREDSGNVTVEVMIVLPVLMWLFGVGWVYFDVFRQQTVSQKANYAIGDMISRQTEPLSDAYMASTFELFSILTQSDQAQSGVRITVAEYDGDADKWVAQWSEMQGAGSAMATADLMELRERLPAVFPGEQLVIVETWDYYDPAFDVGMDEFEIKTYSFTRPRYAPQVLLASMME